MAVGGKKARPVGFPAETLHGLLYRRQRGVLDLVYEKRDGMEVSFEATGS